MFLQGSSYNLPIHITDAKGKTITTDDVTEASFTIGNLTKNYSNYYETGTFRNKEDI